MNVFISYRRNQSGDLTGRIFDELKRQFGTENVFLDIASIHGGEEWQISLEQRISRCGAMLVLIGESWLAELQNRLERDDFVKYEAQSALEKEIPVIPVLLGSTKMPSRASLPDELKRLADFQYVTVRSGKDFPRDIEELTNALRRLATKGRSTPVRRTHWMIVGAIAAALALAAVVLKHNSTEVIPESNRDGTSTTTPKLLELPDGGELRVSLTKEVKVGERAELRLTPNRDLYIRVMHQSSDGYISEIFPDQNGDNWRLERDRPQSISWQTSPPAGTEEVLVYASSSPLRLNREGAKPITKSEFFDTRGIPSAIRVSTGSSPTDLEQSIVQGNFSYRLSD
ncbi:MAG: TIR domain-containing protein [Verrucomicrobiae bacterium]|nr:TIR domain-containing protein [Verrucomicrobiae bacterium]